LQNLLRLSHEKRKKIFNWPDQGLNGVFSRLKGNCGAMLPMFPIKNIYYSILAYRAIPNGAILRSAATLFTHRPSCFQPCFPVCGLRVHGTGAPYRLARITKGLP